MARCDGSTFTLDGGTLRNEHLYRTEASRGYEAQRPAVEPGLLHGRAAAGLRGRP